MFKLNVGSIFEFKTIYKYLNVEPKKLIPQACNFNIGEPTNIDLESEYTCLNQVRVYTPLQHIRVPVVSNDSSCLPSDKLPIDWFHQKKDFWESVRME